MYNRTIITLLAACMAVLGACSSNGTKNKSVKADNAATIAAIDSATINTPTSYSDISDGIETPDADTIDAADRKMVTMENLYYDFGEKLVNNTTSSFLDSIPDLIRTEVKEKWTYAPDSIKFDLIVELYLDRTYPSQTIREQLLSKIDTILMNYIAEDTYLGEEILKATPRPSEKPSATEFANDWKDILLKLTEQNGCTAETECFTEIYNALSFALCHKVYEDAAWVTYLIERGCSGHGGNGCRNKMDYLTFNKASGSLLTINDIVDDSNFAVMNDAIYKEYSARGASFKDDSFNFVEAANGTALLNEGLLVYYHPYIIGPGSEGQYNLLLDKSFFKK